MKTKLMIIGALAATCAVHELAAMPTAEETRQAVPVVKKLLASEHEALKAGRKTRSEVAVAALKRAGEAKTEAEKLLLILPHLARIIAEVFSNPCYDFIPVIAFTQAIQSGVF